MNFIDELLKDEKVEWKKLGEVCEIVRGIRVKKNELISGGKYPVVSGGTGYMGYLNEYNRNEETITIAQYGTAGYVNWQKRKFWANDVCFCVYPKNIILNKYLYYFLSSKQNYLYKVSNKSAIPYSISKENILKIKISIPSLETQGKIVKILDNFTKYVTELQAELQARNKQYNYYRDMLLSEDYLNKISKKLDSLSVENQELRLTTLGEVGKVSMCRRILKNQTTSNGEVPFYKIGTFGKKADSFISKSLFEEYKSRYSFPKKGDILISASGTIGRTVIYNGEDAYFQDSNIVWIDNDETVVKNKYLYYFYSTNPWKISNGGTISRIYNKDIEKIKIFVPPIEIQNKIVKILDRFQELLSDTKGLLPLEIEQRRKQYEYYREKLLTFDKEEGYALSTAQRLITSELFEFLKEAAKIADVDISDKVEWKTLSEVAKYLKDRISFEYLNEKNYIGVENLLKNRLGKIDSSNVPIEGNSIKFDIGDILIGNIRPYLRKIWLADVEGGTNGDVLAIRVKDKNKILPEFLYQLLSDEKFFDYNIKYSKGAKMPRGDKEKIMEYKIPLPPLPVQEYIVSILDKFDALVNDLSQGLPKEIELRQKQYEYYREKLLNFEK